MAPSEHASEEVSTPETAARWKLHAALLTAQAGNAGFQILSARAQRHGSVDSILTLYSSCIGFLVLRLLGYAIERKNKPVFNFPALFIAFLLGFFGVMISEVCYLEGLRHTNLTFASSMRNLIPVFTIILTLIFRMERFNVNKWHGVLKLIGSLLVICGWMVLLVYKGEFLLRGTSSSTPVPHKSHKIGIGEISVTVDNQKYGVLFLIISCFSFSIFLILQEFIMEKCAAPISIASVACFFSIAQLGVIAPLLNRKRSNWSSFNLSEGIAITYGGIIGLGVVFSIQSWGVRQGGAMLVAAYQPTETVISILFSVFLLKESVHLGSIIGGGIILAGFYFLIWGKEREQRLSTVFAISDDSGSIMDRASLDESGHSLDFDASSLSDQQNRHQISDREAPVYYSSETPVYNSSRESSSRRPGSEFSAVAIEENPSFVIRYDFSPEN